MIKAIFASLATPDAQGNDWYGWASNQMSHALLGVIVALYYPSIALAAIIGGLKECGDLLRYPSKVTFVDSLQDIFFWAIGAWLVVANDTTLAVIALVFALICGIVPRLRKLK